MDPEMVAVPLAPSARLPGVRGCKKPGVTVKTAVSEALLAVALGWLASVAFTETETASSVR
jgi:hypothetical protein